MRLIDADKIPFVQSEDGTMNDFAYRYDINEMKTFEPMKHGKWIFDHMTGEVAHYAYCSCCGKMRFWKDIAEYFAYCPDCGTKMDAEEQKNE